jgi:phosphoribosylanthranilate isomerase
MKVKVCGMRDPENISALLELPIDFIGFIFYPPSSRFVGKARLDKWIPANEESFGEIKKVGVFVNAEVEEILNAVHDYRLDYIQLHGNESAEYCRELSLLWQISSVRKARMIKAFAIDEEFDFSQTEAYAPYCSYFLFDTKGKKPGGNGVSFDWSLLEAYQGVTPFLLSGGLGPQSAEAVKALDFPQMSGIDINSKFEKAPAEKDIESIRNFIQEVKNLEKPEL